MTPRKPTVREVLPIVEQYYAQGHLRGGLLHVVLDDGNVEGHFVESCIADPWDPKDTDGLALAHVLRRMSKTQRGRLCAECRGGRVPGADGRLVPIPREQWWSVEEACTALLTLCDLGIGG